MCDIYPEQKIARYRPTDWPKHLTGEQRAELLGVLEAHKLHNLLEAPTELRSKTMLTSICRIGLCEITGAPLYLKVTDELEPFSIQFKIISLPTSAQYMEELTTLWSPDKLARMLHTVVVAVTHSIGSGRIA